MSRRHCHSVRRGTRPGNCALSNNERHHDYQNAPPINIYSLTHAIGVLPRAQHHCYSTRRGARPSICALWNDKRHATALTSTMTLTHPPIYKSGKLSNVALSLSQRPSRNATKQLRPLEQRAASRLPERSPRQYIFPCSSIFHCSCQPSSSVRNLIEAARHTC